MNQAVREHPEPSRKHAIRLAWRSSWRRVRYVLQLVGLGLAVSAAPAPATAQGLAKAGSPPQHWISYAQLASNQFQAWLSDPGNDTVVRLHGWWQERMLSGGPIIAAVPTVVVRVWVAASGQVERLEFPSLGQAQADADLRSLLTAQALSEPPPPDMKQPMVMELALSFASGA